MRGVWSNFIIPNHEKFKDIRCFQYSETGNEFHRLYLSLPKDKSNVPLVIFIHGGGMTEDLREVPDVLYCGDYAVVEIRYRLATDAKAPAQAEDTAMAIAWCFKHAEEYGIDKGRIFVGGMSAGAYLAAIVAMHPRFLAPYGLNAKSFAGIFLCSGQMTTHFRFKADFGDVRGQFAPDFGEYAPMAHLSKDLPPMILLTGEPGLDIKARPEENAFVAATLKALGHTFVQHYALPGHNHGMVLDGGNELLQKFFTEVLKQKIH